MEGDALSSPVRKGGHGGPPSNCNPTSRFRRDRPNGVVLERIVNTGAYFAGSINLFLAFSAFSIDAAEADLQS
jgi:hypothetical protein